MEGSSGGFYNIGDAVDIDCVKFRYCQSACEVLAAVVDPGATIKEHIAICLSSSQTPFTDIEGQIPSQRCTEPGNCVAE